MRLVDLCRLALVAAVGLGSVACGEGFDPQSQVKELRIFGVRKDKPYAVPGESVELTMLWGDPAGRQDLNRQWFPLCINPPGDLYYGCFADPTFLLADPSWLTDPAYKGDVFSAQVPSNIMEGREPAPGQPRFGMIFSFFTLCAGTLEFVETTQEGALPIGCRGDDGKLLGSDDFIIGYASMYVFPDPKAPEQFLLNQNPEVLGFQTAGTDVTTGTCVNADCLDTELEDVDCSNPANDAICFDACADDGEPTCPEIPIKPLLGPKETVAERDQVSIDYYGRDVGEQMWINYFVDRGGVRSDVRLLNDAVTGWNDDFGTDFFAPKESGPVTIWAIARDNRGGTGWVRTRVGIR